MLMFWLGLSLSQMRGPLLLFVEGGGSSIDSLVVFIVAGGVVVHYHI